MNLPGKGSFRICGLVWIDDSERKKNPARKRQIGIMMVCKMNLGKKQGWDNIPFQEIYLSIGIFSDLVLIDGIITTMEKIERKI